MGIRGYIAARPLAEEALISFRWKSSRARPLDPQVLHAKRFAAFHRRDGHHRRKREIDRHLFFLGRHLRAAELGMQDARLFDQLAAAMLVHRTDDVWPDTIHAVGEVALEDRRAK